MVAVLVWVLLAGILDLGRALAAQQVLQNAAASAARELSLRALPPDVDFVPDGRDAIFHDGFLVVDRELLERCELPGDDLSFSAVARAMAKGEAGTLNRLLLPLWIRDRVGDTEVLRYPGAVLQRETPTSGCRSGSRYTVRIPEIGADGSPVWRDVVEALPMDGRADPFPLPLPAPDPDSGGAGPGAADPGVGAWAALRVQYPFQAAGLQAWRDGRMVEATEASGVAPPVGGLTFAATETRGTHAGRLGLGVLYSMGREVRPFRRVLSAGAAFRREVFAPSTGGAR